MADAVCRGYHTVNVCANLQKVKQNYPCGKPTDLPPVHYWPDQMKSPGSPRCKKVQYIMANGPYTSLSHSHAIFLAFLYAYNSHEDIVLSPDDIWLMICSYFSEYVNENAEQLRSLFVDHEGKTKLTVVQTGQSEPDWDHFLENMQVKISENVKNEVTQLLRPTFSTTTKIESLLSCVTVMSTFKKYFEYDLMITMCGIRNVHFMGTLDDWKLLRQKTEQLKTFALPSRQKDQFGRYIDGLLPILDEFVKTYQGNVNRRFWNGVMDVKHVSGSSGEREGEFVSGWFLRMCYGLHQESKCHINDIKLNPISAQITVRNEIIKETKECAVLGGFHGVESCAEHHKPVMSLAVMDVW